MVRTQHATITAHDIAHNPITRGLLRHPVAYTIEQLKTIIKYNRIDITIKRGTLKPEITKAVIRAMVTQALTLAQEFRANHPYSPASNNDIAAAALADAWIDIRGPIPPYGRINYDDYSTRPPKNLPSLHQLPKGTAPTAQTVTHRGHIDLLLHTRIPNTHNDRMTYIIPFRNTTNPNVPVLIMTDTQYASLHRCMRDRSLRFDAPMSVTGTLITSADGSTMGIRPTNIINI